MEAFSIRMVDWSKENWWLLVMIASLLLFVMSLKIGA